MANDGSYVVGGFFEGVVDFDPSSANDERTSFGQDDGFVTKFNADGSYAWTRTFGGPYRDAVDELRLAADDSVVATGTCTGALDFDAQPGAAEPIEGWDRRTYLLKLSPAGALAWSRQWPTNSNRPDPQLALALDGSIYSADSFTSVLDLDPGVGVDTHDASDGSAYLVKLDANGTALWSKVFETEVKGLAVPLDQRPIVLLGWSSLVRFEASGEDGGGFPRLPGYADGVAALDDSIYVFGTFHGTEDFNPNGMSVPRTTAGAEYFWEIDSTGQYRSMHAFTPTEVQVGLRDKAYLEPLPDGGIIWRPANHALLSKFDAQSISSYSLAVGGTVSALAASGAGLVIVGRAPSGTDFDPRPSVQVGEGSFVTRYTF
jgi:hypothetical protein